MKKTIAVIFIVLILAGCSQTIPEKAKSGFEKTKEIACKINPWCDES